MNTNKKKRPVDLHLRTIRLNITGISSFFHRISGIILFMSIGMLLRLLDLSLSSLEEFSQISAMMNNFFIKFIFIFFMFSLIYHILGGIRHILMDFHCLDSTLFIGKFTAEIVIFLTFILTIFVGIAIW